MNATRYEHYQTVTGIINGLEEAKLHKPERELLLQVAQDLLLCSDPAEGFAAFGQATKLLDKLHTNRPRWEYDAKLITQIKEELSACYPIDYSKGVGSQTEETAVTA